MTEDSLGSSIEGVVRRAISDYSSVSFDPVLGTSIERRMSARDDAVRRAAMDMLQLILVESSQTVPIRSRAYGALEEYKRQNRVKEGLRQQNFERNFEKNTVEPIPAPASRPRTLWGKIGDAIYGVRE